MANFFFGNWITRIYLTAVGSAALFALAAGSGSGPSFAVIWLIALTAPVSVIFAPVFLLGEGWLTTPMMFGSVLAGLLLNTLLINVIVGEVFRTRRA